MKSTVAIVLAKAPTVAGHATRKDYVDTGDSALQAQIDGKETLGSAAAARTAHEAASDPHPQYLTASEGNAAYAALSHVHAASDVTSGTFAIGRIPTGTTSTTVALGNDSRITGAEQAANKGAASGYASLDSGTKVPIAQLPTGATGTTVALGNDGRFTDSRAPSGAAGGDLTGTYPNPTIKVALVDPVAGTAGLRTLGTGAQQAAAGNDSRLSDARTPVTHNHAASDVNSGVLAIARIPTGTTSTTVALGDHTHAGGGGAGGGIAAGVIPSNAGTTPSVTHALGTRDLIVSVREVSTDLLVRVATVTTDDNTVQFTFATAPTTGQYRYTILSASASVGSVSHSHAEAEISGLVTDLAGKQPLDSDLTTIAGLTATTDNVIQSAAGAWASRTPAQLKATLALVKGDVGLGNVDNTADTAKPVSTAQQTALDGKQPLDTDLTTIAGLTATTDYFLQAKASAWAARTPAQVAADLVTPLSSSLQPISSNLTTISGLASPTDNIVQSVAGAWASRTPAQLKATLALVKADVGLGSVDNTADTAKPVSTAQQTALNLKADLAGPTFTGTVTLAKSVSTPVGLTDAATIAVNAALGNHFTVTLAGNRTVGVPSNPTHGQRILFEITQDATGSRTLTWTTGAGGFIFGTDITAVTLTTTAAKTDFVGAVYNSTANRWRIIAVAKGY